MRFLPISLFTFLIIVSGSFYAMESKALPVSRAVDELLSTLKSDSSPLKTRNQLWNERPEIKENGELQNTLDDRFITQELQRIVDNGIHTLGDTLSSKAIILQILQKIHELARISQHDDLAVQIIVALIHHLAYSDKLRPVTKVNYVAPEVLAKSQKRYNAILEFLPKRWKDHFTHEYKLSIARIEEQKSIADYLALEEMPSTIHGKLDLRGKNLTHGQGAGLISGMSECTTVILHKNCFVAFPSELLRLKNVKILDLSDNKILTLTPLINMLEHLEKLSLSKNRLLQLPDEICLLRKLTHLLLRDNRLTRLPKKIKELNLKKLCIHNNHLSPEELLRIHEAFKNIDLVCLASLNATPLIDSSWAC